MKRTLALLLALLLTLPFSACGRSCWHKWDRATCTEPARCSLCGQAKGGPRGHKWSDATCSTPKTCSNCAKTDGDALGHNVSTWKETASPTCSNPGVVSGVCENCSQSVTQQTPEAGHSPDSPTIVLEDTASGRRNIDIQPFSVISCQECGEVISSERTSLSAQEFINAFKEICSESDYREILDFCRDPNKVTSENVVAAGVVLCVSHVMGSYNIPVLLVSEAPSSQTNWESSILVSFPEEKAPDFDIPSPGDIITVYGSTEGMSTYVISKNKRQEMPTISPVCLQIETADVH